MTARRNFSPFSMLGRALASDEPESRVLDDRRESGRRDDGTPPRGSNPHAPLLWLAGLVVALSAYAFNDLKRDYRENKAAVAAQIQTVKDQLAARERQDVNDRRLLRRIAKKLKVPEEE